MKIVRVTALKTAWPEETVVVIIKLYAKVHISISFIYLELIEVSLAGNAFCYCVKDCLPFLFSKGGASGWGGLIFCTQCWQVPSVLWKRFVYALATIGIPFINL